MTYAGAVTDEELPGLLAAGERAAFRGVPGQGIIPLEHAAALARETQQPDAAARAEWLLGVCRSAVGLYGQALEGLSRACAEQASPAAYRSLAASALAAVHRELGRHAEARDWDEAAAEVAGEDPEAAFEAWVGLAADAVGLQDPDGAQAALARAEALVADQQLWWRQGIRRDWVRAELALLRGDAAAARVAAQFALDASEAAGAPRHVAMSLLLCGVAAAANDRGDSAVDLLARAAVLAEGLGARPLMWRSQALLAALQARERPADAHQALEAARAVLRQVTADLPADLAGDFLARRDVAALMG